MYAVRLQRHEPQPIDVHTAPGRQRLREEGERRGRLFALELLDAGGVPLGWNDLYTQAHRQADWYCVEQGISIEKESEVAHVLAEGFVAGYDALLVIHDTEQKTRSGLQRAIRLQKAVTRAALRS